MMRQAMIHPKNQVKCWDPHFNMAEQQGDTMAGSTGVTYMYRPISPNIELTDR